MTTVVNWNVNNIFDVRNKHVRLRTGEVVAVHLEIGGWSVGDAAGMDIWSACRVLNNNEATVATPEPASPVTPQENGLAVGDKVRRKTGHTVGVIVAIYPEVKYPYYAAHPTNAKVRWPTPERRRGNGYQHSTLNVANLVKA